MKRIYWVHICSSRIADTFEGERECVSALYKGVVQRQGRTWTTEDNLAMVFDGINGTNAGSSAKRCSASRERHKGPRKMTTLSAIKSVLINGDMTKTSVCRYEKYDQDIDCLNHTGNQSRIVYFTVTEKGTSSRCPECGYRQQPEGRQWVCGSCNYHDHRGVVASINMHLIAYEE
ncbi:MAG: hypothetical protein D6690_02545 [Nitrospirae bacterium]|nr:MAG: hypothetical protein D6690_02545 [Nitrospirota bacterium]